MNDFFQRTAMLIGHDNVINLKNRRVAVFGVGGVGGHCIEALCRCGIGTIDIFDGDVVDVTNINRQLIATSKSIGRNKVDVMRERLLEINPEVIVGANKLFYLPESADWVDLSVYDYVVDAVDTMTAKLELVCKAKAAGVPVISSMGAANKLDATAFRVADIYETSICPMARIMRKELRKHGVEALKVVYSQEVPVGKTGDGSLSYQSCVNAVAKHMIDKTENRPLSYPLPASIAFVPPVVGLILAGEVIKYLIT
ncbi:MAG: tRNA threonylcarbamoyladenosine dehydratase [Oscillospiraceae bacterium]|nr:tRNA threonylcarbamoyladenosine dehydratase [Oscillospiraceae bacterium]